MRLRVRLLTTALVGVAALGGFSVAAAATAAGSHRGKHVRKHRNDHAQASATSAAALSAEAGTAGRFLGQPEHRMVRGDPTQLLLA
jgi:hypothetical protein